MELGKKRCWLPLHLRGPSKALTEFVADVGRLQVLLCTAVLPKGCHQSMEDHLCCAHIPVFTGFSPQILAASWSLEQCDSSPCHWWPPLQGKLTGLLSTLTSPSDHGGTYPELTGRTALEVDAQLDSLVLETGASLGWVPKDWQQEQAGAVSSSLCVLVKHHESAGLENKHAVLSWKEEPVVWVFLGIRKPLSLCVGICVGVWPSVVILYHCPFIHESCVFLLAVMDLIWEDGLCGRMTFSYACVAVCSYLCLLSPFRTIEIFPHNALVKGGETAAQEVFLIRKAFRHLCLAQEHRKQGEHSAHFLSGRKF